MHGTQKFEYRLRLVGNCELPCNRFPLMRFLQKTPSPLAPMQNTLHAHLIYLQDKLQELSDQLTLPLPDPARANIEARIRIAREALDNYLHAYELESSIRDDSSLVS